VSAVLFGVFVALCALALALIDRRRVALRDAEISRLDAEREADVAEAAATYEAASADLREARAEIVQLHLLVDELRCGNLGAFVDDELSPERAEAFRGHLAVCERCQAAHLGLLQQDAIVSSGLERRDAVVAAALAWATGGGPIGAILDAVAELER